jgi:hypothetical protein
MKMGDPRSAWIRDLAAASPKAATPEQREMFANAVLEQLSEAYARGERAQTAWKSIQRIHEAAREIRDALRSFATAIAADSIHAARVGVTVDEFDDVTQPVLSYILKVHSIEDGYDWRDRWHLTRRPGRKSRIAIEIAEMIAYEYDRCFGRPAGRSKQADKNTPFFRVCKVVERILDSTGQNGISLGHDARSEGIDRACTAILKEMSGAPPDSIFVAGNVRALRIRQRSAQGVSGSQSSALRKWGDLLAP